MKPFRMPVLGLLGTTLAFALTTWLLGWWAVPAIAALVVLVFGRWDGLPPAPSDVALGAVLGWALLLALQARAAGFGALLAALGGILRVGSVGVLLVTLLFAGLLAWGTAALVAGLFGRRFVPVRGRTVVRHADRGQGTRRERERVAGR